MAWICQQKNQLIDLDAENSIRILTLKKLSLPQFSLQRPEENNASIWKCQPPRYAWEPYKNQEEITASNISTWELAHRAFCFVNSQTICRYGSILHVVLLICRLRVSSRECMQKNLQLQNTNVYLKLSLRMMYISVYSSILIHEQVTYANALVSYRNGMDYLCTLPIVFQLF